jgi:transposase
MNPSISLRPGERNALLDLYRSRFHDPELRLRPHILLLLADGHTWATVTAVLYCSTRTIARWRDRFERGRIDALLGNAPGPKRRLAEGWADLVADWVLHRTPGAFGFLRGRWCCALLALTLWRVCRLHVSRETVRRWLHERDLVWRRPRPVLRRADPQREAILAGLRALVRNLPDDETVVFEDEVDINLNPEVGRMWMRRGEQAEVVTPGDNEKNYLAASLHGRTGVLLAPVRGPKRNGTLVAAHLDELGRSLRRYRKVHVFCDNAKTHKCAAVNKVLKAHRGRVVLHFLPRYAPECNPVERVWWHLREEITRNHRCRSLEELFELVFAWLEDRKRFPVEDSVYREEDPDQQETTAA